MTGQEARHEAIIYFIVSPEVNGKRARPWMPETIRGSLKAVASSILVLLAKQMIAFPLLQRR
jgi:hypothetical protein